MNKRPIIISIIILISLFIINYTIYKLLSFEIMICIQCSLITAELWGIESEIHKT